MGNFGLKRAALDHEQEFGPAVVNFIHNEFYVDDGVTSVPTAEEAIALIKGSTLCPEWPQAPQVCKQFPGGAAGNT